MDTEDLTPPKPKRRWGRGAALMAGGLVAGGILAGTVTALAAPDDTTTSDVHRGGCRHRRQPI